MEKNILIAFILNLGFSVFEFIGGIYTGSVAIISDAIHDIGDAASIGTSFFLERKSKKQPDEIYTYGYARYSVIGGVSLTLILIFGSTTVIFNAITRIIRPTTINYDKMIIFATIGVIVNSVAAFYTRHSDSVNQKSINLHMIEDVLGWIVVLIGAAIMKFTDYSVIDPILSMGVAFFILISAFKNLKCALDIFLVKIPEGIELSKIKKQITEISGVIDVHHIHIWSMDGMNNYATMHIVTNEVGHIIKDAVRNKLTEEGICHVTLELEKENEHCQYEKCSVIPLRHGHHHH